MGATAIHPDFAFLSIMMCQRKMWRAIPESLSHCDTLGVERVGDTPDRGLRTFLVNVPAFEMLDWAGIHDDQRRMDDGPAFINAPESASPHGSITSGNARPITSSA